MSGFECRRDACDFYTHCLERVGDTGDREYPFGQDESDGSEPTYLADESEVGAYAEALAEQCESEMETTFQRQWPLSNLRNNCGNADLVIHQAYQHHTEDTKLGEE